MNKMSNWLQIEKKLRKALDLIPPTLEEADAEIAKAGEILTDVEQIAKERKCNDPKDNLQTRHKE